MFFRKLNKDTPLTDTELIAKYKQSEENTHVGILYERYSLQIYAICKKYIKEEEESRDTAAQVFEYLLKELLKYEVDNFKSWLGTATRNFCLMKLRKQKSQARQEEEFKNNSIGIMETVTFPHPSNGEAKEAELTALSFALQKLKPHQRTCVELFYLQEKSYEEVAQSTGYSMKEVKSFIQNGKRNLKMQLSQRNE